MSTSAFGCGFTYGGTLPGLDDLIVGGDLLGSLRELLGGRIWPLFEHTHLVTVLAHWVGLQIVLLGLRLSLVNRLVGRRNRPPLLHLHVRAGRALILNGQVSRVINDERRAIH